MTAAPPRPATSHLRWFILSLLFLATTINYMDRQILSLLKSTLDQRMHWTNAQFGVINGYFQAAYAVGLIGFGWFVDRFGVRTGYATSIFTWSLSACAHALVTTVGGFSVARVALGVCEAGNFPSAVKAAAQWFPKSERALAATIFNSGANVGAVLAPVIVPPLAAYYSWQAPFVVVGAAGLIWLAPWLGFYRAPRQKAGISEAELAWIESDQAQVPVASTSEGSVGWGTLLRCRQVWSFVVAKLLTDPVWYFLLVWLPDYFNKARHLDIKNSWPLLTTIYGIITALSLVGGWLTGHLVRRGWGVTRARKTGMLLFAVIPLGILFVGQVGNWWAVLLIGLTGAAHQAWSANLYTTVSDMFPNRAIARIIGLGSMAGSLGSIYLNVATGRLLDQMGSAGAGRSYALLFGYCGCAYLVAFAVNHLLAPRFDPVDLREAAAA